MAKVRCPCGRQYVVAEKLVGTRVKCGACSRTFVAQPVETPAAEAKAPASPRKPPRKKQYAPPVTEEQREALRRSMEAAARQHDEQRAASAPPPPSRFSWLRPIHFAALGAAILAAALIVGLWPAPAAERTLVAYLRSCDEDAVEPDNSLAVRDFGLAVREFRDVVLLPARDHDYAQELETFARQEKGNGWADLLANLKAAQDKRRALALLAPSLPKDLGPRAIGSLRITAQPATCYLHFRQRGMGVYTEGRYRFLLLKAESPSWRSGWRVAACEPAGAAAPG